PAGDVDAVPLHIFAFDENVTQVDTYPEVQFLLRWNFSVMSRKGSLDIDGAAQRVDDTGQFDQQAIAHGLHQTAVVFSDAGFEDSLLECNESGPRSFLIAMALTAVAGS